VTLGLAAAGVFTWQQVPGFVAAQMAGGVCGGILVYLFYMDQAGRSALPTRTWSIVARQATELPR
jgi:glycerol uptake facilitator protein